MRHHLPFSIGPSVPEDGGLTGGREGTSPKVSFELILLQYTWVLTTYSPILRVSSAVFFAFLKPREADWPVLLLCMDERAEYIPRLTAWVTRAATGGFSPDGSNERVGGGVRSFSVGAVIFTSRAVLAKTCLPVLRSMTWRPRGRGGGSLARCLSLALDH